MINSSLLLARPPAPGPSYPLLTGLARYYNLDGDGLDAHGGQHATVTGSGFVTGKLGQGFDFAANTGRSIVAPAFNPLGAMSLIFWVKFNSGGGSLYSQVVGQMLGGGGNQNFTLLNQGGYDITWFEYANTPVISMDFGSIGPGVWAQCAFTRSAANVVKGYRNAVLTATASGSAIVSVPGANLRFGTRDDLYSGFNGALDKVALWTSELSGADIATSYNGGAALAYP